MFKQNAATLDRVIRLILGIVLLVVSLVTLKIMGNAVWGSVAAVISLMLVVTVATGFCPVYRFLGLETKKCTRK